jgi:3-oxoadipate enol-lactonase
MKTLSINGATIAYVDSGPVDGVAVVLSHSLFFDHTMFDGLTALLVEDGYRVVAYDHRGQGASSRAERSELGMDTLTEDAAQLIEAVGLGKVHFAGNSMGGFIALRLAARRPDLLLSAIALGSSAEEEHQLEAFAPLVDALKEHGSGAVIDPLMHIMFSDTSLAEPSESTLAWRQFMLSLDRSIGDCAWQVIHRSSIVEELSGCAVPVLAIAGAEDHAYPPPISSVNIAAATGGSAVVLEAAGHSVALEQSGPVATRLTEFFATTRQPA